MLGKIHALNLSLQHTDYQSTVHSIPAMYMNNLKPQSKILGVHIKVELKATN